MKNVFLFSLMALTSLCAVADEATHLRVHRTDGTVLNAALDEQLVLDFLQENIGEYMALRQASEADVQIALLEIRKMTFGDALVEESEPDPEPDVPTDEHGTMYVHYTDGTVFTASLDEQVVLRFLSENVKISMLERAPLVVEVADVQKITFSPEGINVPNFVEEVFADDFCVYAAAKTIFAQSTAAMQGIKIWNLQGQQVLNKNLGNQQRAEISASHLPNGVYVVQITTEEKIETQKVILK